MRRYDEIHLSALPAAIWFAMAASSVLLSGRALNLGWGWLGQSDVAMPQRAAVLGHRYIALPQPPQHNDYCGCT